MTIFTVDVASVPDRDELVVEIWCGDVQFAELRDEGGITRVQLYQRTTGQPWDVSLDELQAALQRAADRLKALGPA